MFCPSPKGMVLTAIIKTSVTDWPGGLTEEAVGQMCSLIQHVRLRSGLVWRGIAWAAVTSLLLTVAACGVQADTKGAEPRKEEVYNRARQKMVDFQIAARGIKDPAVLEAMRSVPRHLFIPEQFRFEAYNDHPVPIGWGQTISQPYVVGFMTEALKLRPGDRVLEVGTGHGYQAAVLSKLAKEVYTIEIVPALGNEAKQILVSLGLNNVTVRIGDGYSGWPEKAPFNAIIITAACDHVPKPLIDQLAPEGRLVAPVGEMWQDLVRITKTDKGLDQEYLLPVAFVPMTGEVQRH